MPHHRLRVASATGLAAAAVVLAAPGVGPAPALAAAPTRGFGASFTDTCSVIGNTYPVPAVVTGRIPVSVPHGQTFQLTGITFSATIPAELATTAYDLGARRAVLRLQVIDARGAGVSPAVKNVLPRDVPVTVPVRRGHPMPFATPAAGVTAGFRAGDRAGKGTLLAGSVRATITLLRADGSVLVRDEPVTCAAPRPAVTVTTIRIA